MVLVVFCVEIFHMFFTFRNTNGMKSDVAQLGEAIIEDINFYFLISNSITEAFFQAE